MISDPLTSPKGRAEQLIHIESEPDGKHFGVIIDECQGRIDVEGLRKLVALADVALQAHGKVPLRVRFLPYKTVNVNGHTAILTHHSVHQNVSGASGGGRSYSWDPGTATLKLEIEMALSGPGADEILGLLRQ